MMIKTLTETVRLATGIKDAEPRPGQKSLTVDIEAAIRANGHAVGVAPTGVGKSFSLLAPAMVAAAQLGQRTIISTESLSLMAQIIDKDAPVAAAACEKTTGVRPEVAVLKGFSNYVCGQTARASAENVTGTSGARPTVRELISKLRAMKPTGTLMLEGRPFDKANGLPLLEWALSLGPSDTGDKQTYEGNVTPELWDMVSVGPSECIGNTCPLFDLCKPRGARLKAADADVVITNHSMLAVQAAKGVPVLIGNKTLGDFHIIMVDEAHTLPGNVRSAGSCEVSAATVLSLTKSIGRVLDEMEKPVEQLIKEGNALAIELNTELKEAARNGKQGETFKLGENADPVEATGDMMIAWARSLKGALETPANSSNTSIQIKAKRLSGRCDAFIANVVQVKLHKTGTARWIEEKIPGKEARNQNPYWAAAASPVNVSGMLLANLWTANAVPDEEDELAQAMRDAGEPDERETETYPMTVIAVSATLPARFGFQAGLTAENIDYPSPFDKAYGSSLLYVPKPDQRDLSELYPGWKPGGYRAKFNTKLHQDWASRKNVELVDANTGSGLILSASSAAGKAYAADLRRAAGKRWNVYSQWDGLSTRQLINAWREDESSVLVGTRSLMTGVDAKGRTCSLVSIDRVPRAAGNPVDDARVEVLMEAMQIDKWSADRFVYVQDASLLLEQAVGRLIRSMDDVGMVAVLDPRFLKNGPVSYPEPTRLIYKKAVARFSSMTTNQDVAEQFLYKISATGPLFMAA
ncbi:MAG TPA: ATP-dependent DNA helicase [Arthrobacter sp.]